MHIFFLRRLFVTSLSFSYSQAWPLSKLWTRQGLTLDVCADPKAVPDANCFNLANVPDYLNNPNTGWIHTTPTCVDSTKCCIPDDDGWTTCFLRLALPASGQDCTTLNDHPCTAQAVLDPNLAPSILPQVRYTVMSIYGVHGFFAQYFDSLNMAYAQALSVITDMTLLLDPDKTASISIFAVLSALTVGLAFLTAPSVAAGMLTMEASALYTAQSFAIGLQQAPGVARALWPSGDDLSRTYQIGQLQDQVSNITVELGNTLSRGLHILMTDVTTFVSFAENGRYSNNNPPLDPNVLKNNLAIVLQTYMLSQSIKQNGWYAIPLGVSTQAEYEALHDPPCFQTIHGCQPSAITVSQIYWSPVTGRQYQMWQKGGGPTGPGKILDEIKNAGWANMPLMFDGAFNCTAQGQLDNPQLVHVNFDGTLDASCISQFPIQIACGAPCPQMAPDGSCHFPYKDDCNKPRQNTGDLHGRYKA